MTDHYNYCKGKAAPDGSNLYYATLFESNDLKKQLFIIFALHYEIIECLSASPDPGVTRLKLQWWSEEIERLFQGQARHPVTTQLHPFLKEIVDNASPFLTYMTTLDSIVSAQVKETVDDWFNQFSQGLGQIWYCASRLSTPINDITLSLTTRNGGIIFTLDLLQNLKILTSKGYNFLPSELLEKHKLPRDSLSDLANNGSSTLLFKDLLIRIEDELDSTYSRLKSSARNIPTYHLIMNRIARTTCIEIQKDGCQLLKHKIALTPIRKFLIAWQIKLFR